MDRGFPSHELVRHLQAAGWRFVIRLKSNWKLTHAGYTGQLRGAPAVCVGPTPQLWRDGVLGDRRKGAGTRVRWGQAHVVAWHGPDHAEPWFLVTRETDAAQAVQWYRERMRIEGEFRDLKGPLGLDQLAAWLDAERIARFLAWVAVYEWRLAYLWDTQQLCEYAIAWQIKGRLRWIRTAREWVAHQFRRRRLQPDACL